METFVTELIRFEVFSFTDSEPFVLQSEMGMSGRSLALLDLLTECHPKMSKTIIEKVLMWLIMIVKDWYSLILIRLKERIAVVLNIQMSVISLRFFLFASSYDKPSP